MKWYEKNTAQEKLFHLVIKNKGEYLTIYYPSLFDNKDRFNKELGL